LEPEGGDQVTASEETGPMQAEDGHVASVGEAVQAGALAANPLRHWLERNAARAPGKVFIHSIDQDKAITNAQVLETTRRLSAYLDAAGIGANDRVALLSNNSLEHLATYLGVMAHGATICTINVEMNAAYFEDILNGLAPRLVLFEDEAVAADLATSTPGDWQALGDWRPDGGSGLFAALAEYDAAAWHGGASERTDDACIYYTSGTSARPKGVVLSFGELIDNIEPIADAFGIGEDDRMLDFRSYNWASAQILSGLAPLARGATVVMARKFSRSRFFGWIRDHKATIAAGNPTTLNMLMSEAGALSGADFPSLRYITSSSAPLTVEEAKRFEARFKIPIGQGYGTSEAGWIAGSNDATRRLGSVGKPLPYHDLKIVDAEGCALPAGEIGLVELGNDPAREYRYVDPNGGVQVHARGRFRTGDLGYLDADGYLFITGRERDLIIRGGVNIAPIEIDGVLLQREEVAEAATIGVPDPIYGEEVVSYVVLKPDAAIGEAALLKHCGASLPAFKAPKQILFREALPKSERGKIDRRALIAEWQREAAAEA
jgi:acyl-CoA synthetase (AMP-forming)/AMP-acid ligase II